MNVDFTFGTLYIDGLLLFEDGLTPSEINLIANNICTYYTPKLPSAQTLPLNGSVGVIATPPHLPPSQKLTLLVVRYGRV